MKKRIFIYGLLLMLATLLLSGCLCLWPFCYGDGGGGDDHHHGGGHWEGGGREGHGGHGDYGRR